LTLLIFTRKVGHFVQISGEIELPRSKMCLKYSFHFKALDSWHLHRGL